LINPVINSAIYCQFCRAANSISDSHCSECGTRLLLAVFPNSLQYDTNQTPSFYEDHLLERVSLLELRHAQLSEALGGVVEVIRDQSRIIKEERDLIKELYAILGMLKTDETARIREAWDAVLERRIGETGAPADGFASIIESYDGGNPELFAKLISEGREHLRGENERQAIRVLERARLLSPRNFPLLLHCARRLFAIDKYEAALESAADALSVRPDDVSALFLAGILNAETGNADAARRHLGILVNENGFAAAINLVWGLLAARDGNWTECIAAFKQGAAVRPAAEFDYLTGCAYFQLGRLPMAVRHFGGAVRSDPGYSDAWFMKGLAHGRAGEASKADDAFANAGAKSESGAQCAELLRRKNIGFDGEALPFRHFAKSGTPVVSGASLRIRRFFRTEVDRLIDRETE
jgi:tetratricopeptide (TPR) repeat protein